MATALQTTEQSRRWSPHEDELLLSMLPTTSIEDICRYLPSRTKRAIDARARRLSQEPKREYAKSSEWLTPERLAELQEMASTMMGYQIAMTLGISVQTLAKWRQRYPEIREALDRGNATRKGKPKPWQQVKQQPKQKTVKKTDRKPAVAVAIESKPEPAPIPKPKAESKMVKPKAPKRKCAGCEWARSLVRSGSQVLCIWPTCVKEDGEQ